MDSGMTQLAKLVAHTQWANRAWLGFVAEKTPADEWMWQRISHILLGERAWFQRIAGETPDRQIWLRLDSARLEELLDAHGRIYADLLAGDLTRVIAFQRFTGEQYQSPVGDILLHLVLHGVHHRGQMATRASAIGVPPVNTDFIQYCLLNHV
jgi:uncharacterized damage-inducible protein DinB